VEYFNPVDYNSELLADFSGNGYFVRNDLKHFYYGYPSPRHSQHHVNNVWKEDTIDAIRIETSWERLM